jgi:hypothetical protein
MGWVNLYLFSVLSAILRSEWIWLVEYTGCGGDGLRHIVYRVTIGTRSTPEQGPIVLACAPEYSNATSKIGRLESGTVGQGRDIYSDRQRIVDERNRESKMPILYSYIRNGIWTIERVRCTPSLLRSTTRSSIREYSYSLLGVSTEYTVKLIGAWTSCQDIRFCSQ